MKFARLEKPSEPEFRPSTSSKIFVIAIGSVAKKMLKKRLETDVANEIGGVAIMDMKEDEVTECYDFVKKYLPENRIVPVPLVAEGKIVAGSKDAKKVLDHRHLYLQRLNSAISRIEQIVITSGITVVEVWCSEGGHSIITIEALLKIQHIVTYRKVILMEATEKLARRNEAELLSCFKQWAKQNRENQFFYARNPMGDENIDYAIAIAISSTYGLPSADLTDFFSSLTHVESVQTIKPQCFELQNVCGSYPIYPYWHFWGRQNINRTQRAVALAFDAIKLSDDSLAILSGNIVSDFVEEETGRIYDEQNVRPEIRQFNQIKIEKSNDIEFNFCVSKFELLDVVDIATPTIDALFKKMDEMP